MRPVPLGLAVLALAFPPTAAAKEASGVKWVPLNQVERGPPKRAPVPATTTQPAAAQPATTPATPQPTASAPVPAPVPIPAASVVSISARLDLTCFGAGTANKVAAATAFSNAYASGLVGTNTWSGHGSGTTTVYGTRQQAFGDQVDVRLFGGDDRIRMPRTMLPLIRGGKDGWFKLKNVVANTRSIRAKAAVNFANNPNVFIDRVTGTISISGKAGDYSGQCQAIDASAPTKF